MLHYRPAVLLMAVEYLASYRFNLPITTPDVFKCTLGPQLATVVYYFHLAKLIVTRGTINEWQATV